MKKIFGIIKKLNKNEKGMSTLEFIMILFLFAVVLSSVRYYFVEFLYGGSGNNNVGFAERAIDNTSATLSDDDNQDTAEDEGKLIVQDGLKGGCVQLSDDYFQCP